MSIPYRALPSYTLRPNTSFYRYGQGLPKRVTPDSGALDVMTDLKRVKAVTITPDATLDNALQKMIHAEVRLLLVTDAQGTVLGLVTARDVRGEKPVNYLARTRSAREEIRVEHIMTPNEKIQVLHIDDVTRASVGDIILTLKEAGRQHALVLEKSASGEGDIIRGIFSITQIGKQLGVDIQPSGRVQSFAELEAVLAGDQHLAEIARS